MPVQSANVAQIPQSPTIANECHWYIQLVSNILYNNCYRQLRNENVANIPSVLSKQLENFVLEQSRTSQEQTEKDAMSLLYTHRDKIAQFVKDQCDNDPEMKEGGPSIAEEGVTNNPAVESDKERVPEGISHCCDDTIDHATFSWVIRRLRSLSDLTLPDSHAMNSISDFILEHLIAIRASNSQQPPEIFQVTINTDCNPIAYAKQEGYESAAEVLPEIVTLTGSLPKAQHLTVKEYSSQAWPTTGYHVLQCIQSALKHGPQSNRMPVKYKGQHEGQTKPTVFLKNGKITIQVLSTAYEIAKIGEQMGWLATTLSLTAKDEEKSISCRYPKISGFKTDYLSPSSSTAAAFICEIKVITESSGDESLNLSHYELYSRSHGQIITTGYPIPRRDFSGLEMSWDIMMEEVLFIQPNSYRHLTNHHTYTCVKRLPQVLISIRNENNIISWHLLILRDDQRISYHDRPVEQAILLGNKDELPEIVGSARHILTAVSMSTEI
ncbi:hypothetical protein GGI35DRAFT_463623 [Trichoderma velutinum]